MESYQNFINSYISEFYIRHFLKRLNFNMENFSLKVNGNRGILMDRLGNKTVLVYEPRKRSVRIENYGVMVKPERKRGIV